MAGDKDAPAPIPHQGSDRSATISVEIVRRLVQEQEVRRLDDETSDADARPLPARQGLEVTIQRQVGKPGLYECGADAALQGPVGGVEVAGGAVPRQDAFQHLQTVRDAERFGQGPPSWHVLPEDTDRTRSPNSAGRRLGGTRNDTKEGGFAGTVAANEPDTFRPNRERQIAEERAVRRPGGDGVEREEDGHGQPWHG
jgi:hypothetical protein